MDFDLEIINEEEDYPNHLFESIMNAMNSMKEATADKIYQKIQRDGETNYSKPQVDKALANALKYGIFEVKNNRYRVRDDILDDEDTVYWKLHEKKDRMPFRIQEHFSEKQLGLKLDPERDNQRFRKFTCTELHECPHCGRIKRVKRSGKKKKRIIHKKSEKHASSKKNKSRKITERDSANYKNAGSNRKEWCGRHKEEISMKRKKPHKERKEIRSPTSDTLLKDFWIETKELRENGSFDSTYSHINFLEADQDVENSAKENKASRNNNNNKTNTNNNKNNNNNSNIKSPRSHHSSERDTRERENNSDTESGASDVTITKNYQNHGDFWDSMMEFEESKTSSRNENNPVRNQYARSVEKYNNYDNSQANTGTSDWLGHSDEPQGTIIQSNNVLTIEPMDSLAFESPEQASYIT